MNEINVNDIQLPELQENENVCVALSGGLDSTTLVYLLVDKYGPERVKALSFDFGQRHRVELDMAKRSTKFLGIDHEVIVLDYLKKISQKTSALIEGSELTPKTAEENAGDPQVNTYVPWRNAQFAFVTAAYAETNDCRYIFQATSQVDEYGYYDTTSTFRDALNVVFSLNRKNPITLVTPFVELYKDEEIQLAKQLSKKFNHELLADTWSCYRGPLIENNYKECGTCNTCSEKLTGYIQAEVSDTEILDKFFITQDELDSKKELIKE